MQQKQFFTVVRSRKAGEILVKVWDDDLASSPVNVFRGFSSVQSAEEWALQFWPMDDTDQDWIAESLARQDRRVVADIIREGGHAAASPSFA